MIPKILIDSFDNNNCEQIMEALNATPVSPIRAMNLPQFRFESDADIESGYYDFEINGLSFHQCWVEQVAIRENLRFEYRSGSYYVYKTDEPNEPFDENTPVLDDIDGN